MSRRRRVRTGRAELLTLTDDDVCRFWAKVVIGEPGECWPWATKTGDPYPVFRIYRAGRVYYVGAHVVSLTLKLGHDRFDYAEHSCDFKRCVNPEHLSAGDVSSNTRDAWARGRFPIMRTRRTDQLLLSPELLTL